MGLFRILKRNARQALRGSWGKAALVVLVELLVASIFAAIQQAAITVFVVQPLLSNPTSVPPPDTFGALWLLLSASRTELIIYAAFSVLSAVFVAPLSLGAMRWYYLLVSGRPAGFTEIFYYFESWRFYSRALWYTVSMNLRFLFWSVLFFAPVGGVLGISVYFLQAGLADRRAALLAAFGVGLSVALFVLAAVLFGAFVQRWALVPYLLGEGELTVGKAVRESVAATKGARFRLFWFGLSFIGWIFLCVFVFPVFYAGPFIGAAMAVFARYLIEKSRREPPEGTREFVVNGEPPKADPQP